METGERVTQLQKRMNFFQKKRENLEGRMRRARIENGSHFDYDPDYFVASKIMDRVDRLETETDILLDKLLSSLLNFGE